MQKQLMRFFEFSHYDTESEIYQARVIHVITGMIMLFYTIHALFVPDWNAARWMDAEPGTLATLFEIMTYRPASIPALMLYLVYIVGFVVIAVTRRGYARYGAWMLMGGWFISGVWLVVANDRYPAIGAMPALILCIIAALLVGQRGILLAWVLSMAVMLLRFGDSEITDVVRASLITAMMMLSGGAFITALFLRYVGVSRSEGATRVSSGREVANEVLMRIAQQVSRRVRLDALLSEIVTEVSRQFTFVYHAQVFLIEEGGHTANLVASTGEVGQQLMARGHRLEIGSPSVIGQATFHGKPVIARAGERDTIHRRNELLPDTRVEAAFPLRVGDRIIGALDLQSTDAHAFDDENLTATFQALADSITLAIDNVRQYESAQARLQENERLVEETRKALREVERLNERLTGQAWADYLQGFGQVMGLTVDFEQDAVNPHADLTPTLQEAMQIKHLVQNQVGDRQVIAVPLRVRGRVIGAMEFELDEQRAFSPEDFDMVQEVSERFGLALENARLVDESQRVAQREALVNQISTRLQSSNDVDAMLGEAARSLQNVLKAPKVAIRLGTPPQDRKETMRE